MLKLPSPTLLRAIPSIASSSSSHATHIIPSSRRTFFPFTSFLSPDQHGEIQPSDVLSRKLEKRGEDNRYEEVRILPYSAQELYRVIADVDSYSAFVPFCTSSRVLSSLPSNSKPWVTDDGTTSPPKKYEFEGELSVGFMGLEESYVSKVECWPIREVKATAHPSSHLFRSLSTCWVLQSHRTYPSRTTVSFSITYSFASPVYSSISSMFFEKVSGQMVPAFEERCEEIRIREGKA